MKQIILISLCLIFSLFLLGCGNGSVSGDQKIVVSGGASGTVDTMKAAFAYGGKMKCTYSDSYGNSADLYVRNGEQRIESNSNGETQVVLYKKNMMYSWSETTKKGYKWDINSMQAFVKGIAGDAKKVAGSYQSRDNYVDAYKDIKLKCSKFGISDNKFVAPTDVSFEDMTKMMKEAQEQLDDLKKQMKDMQGMPEGIKIPDMG